MKLFKVLFLIITATTCYRAYDFDNGNALRTWLGVLLQIGRDQPVTLAIRNGAVTGDVTWEAWAPYTNKSLGLYLGDTLRRPANEHTNANKNKAIARAYFLSSSALYPENKELYREKYATIFGLDPDDDTMDPTNPIGIGNIVADVVINAHYRDGMNQLGDEDCIMYNKMNYSDYTGYEPENSPYFLSNPYKWQPNILDVKRSHYHRIYAQTFLMPQLARVELFGNFDLDSFIEQFPGPITQKSAYRKQAKAAIKAVADLDERKKMLAEFFDDKLKVVLVAVALGAQDPPGDVNPYLAFVVNHAFLDSAIVSWAAKTKYDYVRPFSAVRWLKSGKIIKSWGGPGYGTVSMDGSQFSSYLNTDAFPEYPSGSSCLCRTFAKLGQLLTGSDYLNYTVVIPKGASVIEPGFLPTTDYTLHWDSWSQFADECSQSRIDSGVHFEQAVHDTIGVCEQIADYSYDRYLNLLNGIDE